VENPTTISVAPEVAPAANGMALVDAIANEQTEALMAAKTEKLACGEQMTKGDVREVLAAVLRKHLSSVRLEKPEVTPEERIYAAYPKKIGRTKALKAIAAALSDIPFKQLLAATVAYADAVKRWPANERSKFCPHPSTWFNRGSFTDDPAEWERGAQRKPDAPRKGYSL
jgi:hypothetical protein